MCDPHGKTCRNLWIKRLRICLEAILINLLDSPKVFADTDMLHQCAKTTELEWKARTSHTPLGLACVDVPNGHPLGSSIRCSCDPCLTLSQSRWYSLVRDANQHGQ